MGESRAEREDSLEMEQGVGAVGMAGVEAKQGNERQGDPDGKRQPGLVRQGED
jgi:hypothetical protein